jgi:hypothetical protein
MPWLQPQRNEVVSRIDVPTIAGMVPALECNVGLRLLDYNQRNFAFITSTSGKIGMVTDDFF